MRVRYDDDAFEELFEAVHWYEEQRPGLGARFHASVRASERLAAHAPRSYPVLERLGSSVIRRALVQDFPYGLLFLESDGCVWILAVMHLHRLPGYWRKRTAAARRSTR